MAGYIPCFSECPSRLYPLTWANGGTMRAMLSPFFNGFFLRLVMVTLLSLHRVSIIRSVTQFLYVRRVINWKLAKGYPTQGEHHQTMRGAKLCCRWGQFSVDVTIRGTVEQTLNALLDAEAVLMRLKADEPTENGSFLNDRLISFLNNYCLQLPNN